MAHYDFGVKTLDEFGRMTPGMFMALMKRQVVRFRHECYVAGITASMVANVKRTKNEQKLWSPFDFVPDEKANKARERLKHNIATMFAMVAHEGANSMPEQELVERTIERLKAAGHRDVESIFDEMFPGWKKEN